MANLKELIKMRDDLKRYLENASDLPQTEFNKKYLQGQRETLKEYEKKINELQL